MFNCNNLTRQQYLDMSKLLGRDIEELITLPCNTLSDLMTDYCLSIKTACESSLKDSTEQGKLVEKACKVCEEYPGLPIRG
jgi:hypothetical protein